MIRPGLHLNIKLDRASRLKLAGVCTLKERRGRKMRSLPRLLRNAWNDLIGPRVAEIRRRRRVCVTRVTIASDL